MSVTPNSVSEWLTYIESLHPTSIEMGLTRVHEVARRLAFNYTYPVITVGGTNGKGSTCAMLEQIYLDAGYQVACYTSPHLQRYQERVRLNRVEVEDALLCQAFAAVEHARQEISLTYFEIGTLAALWIFEQTSPDVVILEVGLGGRLDAVNIVDADCAIVTNVDMDHMDYLGDTRDKIGAEKAGIYRKQQISICGDIHPPAGLLNTALKQGVQLHKIGVDFEIQCLDDAHVYQDAAGTIVLAPLSLVGDYQWQNAASVIYAVRALQDRLPLDGSVITTALAHTKLTGRFQYLHRAPDVIVDVAHNPHAALALLKNLKSIKQEGVKLRAVFSMLADKDIANVIQILSRHIDTWAIAPIEHPRAVDLAVLHDALAEFVPKNNIFSFETLQEALHAMYKVSAKNDKIIVFGSFFTVAAILDCADAVAAELNRFIPKN